MLAIVTIIMLCVIECSGRVLRDATQGKRANIAQQVA